MAFNVKIKTDENVFAGLAKQNMLFHQCVMELVDNALAAARKNVKPTINIIFKPIDNNDEYFDLYILDNGKGICRKIIEDNLLQLGHQPATSSRLNEHGFGFKNALVTLSGGNGDWSLWTKDCENGEKYLIKGPFKENMVVEDNDVEFPDVESVLDVSEISTIILVRVKKSFAQTVQGRGAKSNDLSVYRDWLLEHLGVAYRGYLTLDDETQEIKAKLAVNIYGSAPTWAKAINVPITSMNKAHFNVELGGIEYELTYRYGIIDEVERDSMLRGKKLKYYYQGNMATQGIDIRLGDRVIATRQLENIWTVADGKPLSRDNHYNDFVGELLIPEVPRGVLSTVNNKTDFNLEDPDWQKIFDKLNKEYKPIKYAKKVTEQELRDKWAGMIKATNPNDTVSEEEHVWGTGVRIDVYREEPNKDITIYELKVGSAQPIHLYQLKMYWDGEVLAGKQPKEGILLVESYSDSMKKMAEEMNSLTPPKYNNVETKKYSFIIKTHKEVNLID